MKAGKLEELLGPARFKPDLPRTRGEIGLVRGLAYTSVGGEVLDVEVAVVPGNGKLELTGNLGDVMKESARAAITYIRSRTQVLGLAPDFYQKNDIHIHFPEGAVPKDGPSAGITMTIALISALTGRPVRPDIAMTGEITLRGRVLPIGGLREKTMAALRSGVKTVIIPRDNLPDLETIDQTVRASLQFVPAEHVDEILDLALMGEPSRADKDSVVAMPHSESTAKSSVINRLLNRNNFARVGASPGKTVHVNYFLIDEKVYLVDLPGYGYAKVSQAERDRWGKLMEDFFAAEDLFDLGILIVDARHKPTADDVTMAEWFKQSGRRFVVVANKLDKLKKSEIEPNLSLIRQTLELPESVVLIPFSAEKGQGRDLLMSQILSLLS